MTESLNNFFHFRGIENIGRHADDIRPIVLTTENGVSWILHANCTSATDAVRLYADTLSGATEEDANTAFVPGDGVGDSPSGFVKVVILDVFEGAEVFDLDHARVTAPQ